MPFRSTNELRIFEFQSFYDEWLDHGIFTRHGGVSNGPFASLNVGSTVGDDLENVRENKRRIFNSLARDPESSHDIWQVHSAKVLAASKPRQGPPYPKADGLVTNSPGLTLTMRFADCVPLLLIDPENHAIGMIHAGWQGTIRGAAQAGVQMMMDRFGSRPEAIKAGLGPSIRRHHYPVGPEVIEAFQQSFGRGYQDHVEVNDGQYHFDLISANQAALRSMGVRLIEDSEICTACHLEDWYSHRGQQGKAGRFAAVIGIRS
jgi:YfiH family protein